MTGALRAIVSENLWRAQREGVRASFIDLTRGRPISCTEYLGSLIDQIAIDASELNCMVEVERTREIVASGTSADRQLAVLAESQNTGLAGREAIVPVVDWIARTTGGS